MATVTVQAIFGSLDQGLRDGILVGVERARLAGPVTDHDPRGAGLATACQRGRDGARDPARARRTGRVRAAGKARHQAAAVRVAGPGPASAASSPITTLRS